MPTANAADSAEIIIYRGHSPVALFFLAVPAALLVMIGIAVAIYGFPPALNALLGILAVSCMMWIRSAIGEIGNVKLEMTNEELRVIRMFGSDGYSWSHIDEVKVFNPGPTLGDSGRHDGVRVGLGLFLKEPGKTRDPNADPEILLVSGSEELAEPIIKASERITSFHRRMSKGRGRSKSGPVGFNKSNKSFRRSVVSSA